MFVRTSSAPINIELIQKREITMGKSKKYCFIGAMAWAIVNVYRLFNNEALTFAFLLVSLVVFIGIGFVAGKIQEGMPTK